MAMAPSATDTALPLVLHFMPDFTERSLEEVLAEEEAGQVVRFPKVSPIKVALTIFCPADRGNSLEDDRSPGVVQGRGSPPAIHLSPSRQSSSSTSDQDPKGGSQFLVAKKKRELFSARSSRSGGSAHSSTSDQSKEFSCKVTLYKFVCQKNPNGPIYSDMSRLGQADRVKA